MKYYLVDAFTDSLFSGNPAAVCIMDQWLEPELMQKIAQENNLSETAFAVPSNKPNVDYDLRWFTPNQEAGICGHATLATSFVIFSFYRPEAEALSFSTKAGILGVTKKKELYELNFPIYPTKPHPISQLMVEALSGTQPKEAFLSDEYLFFVMENDEQVRTVEPDLAKMLLIEEGYGGCVVTASGDDCDFVSRVFIPAYGIPEDPVNGSSHCSTVPFWAEKLNKDSLVAKMRSARGGTLHCAVGGDRVYLAGHAVLYAECEMQLFS